MAKKGGLPANHSSAVKKIQQELNISGNQARKAVNIMNSFSMSYRSGPFPHPEEYEQYMEIDPELPQLIKLMAQKEQDHLHDQNNLSMSNQLTLRKRGQWFGFLIFAMVIALGAYAMYSGSEWAGTIISVTGVAGIITQYLKG